MATKNERVKDFSWVDVIPAILMVGIVSLLGYGGIITWTIVAIIYTLIIRKVWIFLFPKLYRQLVCSECHKVVSQEATECQNCGAQFKV